MSTPLAIVFDVDETPLATESIGPLFERVCGDGKVLRDWFSQLVLSRWPQMHRCPSRGCRNPRRSHRTCPELRGV